jgi:hypothetical protein
MKTGLTATSESMFIFGPGEVLYYFDEEYGVGTRSVQQGETQLLISAGL